MKLQSIWRVKHKKFYQFERERKSNSTFRTSNKKKSNESLERSSETIAEQQWKKSFDQNQISECCKRNDKCRKRFNWILNKQTKNTNTRIHSSVDWKVVIYLDFSVGYCIDRTRFYCCHRCHCLMTGKFGAFICIICTYTTCYTFCPLDTFVLCFVWSCLNGDA